MIRTIVTLTLLAAIALPGKAQTVAEQYLVQLANEHRAEHNLPPLVWDAALARAAHMHAQRIVHEAPSVEHQYPGEPDLTARTAQAGARFSTVAENIVGNARSADEIDRSWMASPTHRANILDPRLTAIGIAVLSSNRALFAVEDFSHQTPALPASDIEQKVTGLLRDHGIQPNPDPSTQKDARATCERGQIVGRPTLSIQWDGANLEEIPSVILRQMPSATAHTAAVGSCSSQRAATDGFTTYRVTILMY